MGAPGAGMEAAEQAAAETLLTAFKAIDTAERSRHASVLNYWLSIRGDKEFPPLHDLDPLELSDAGPNSILMELISGGHDAEIRHLGEALRDEAWPERIMSRSSDSWPTKMPPGRRRRCSSAKSRFWCSGAGEDHL